MEGNWVLKVYAKNNQQSIVNRICRKKNTKYRDNCYITTYINKPKKEIKKLRFAKVQFLCYRIEYERASNYRKIFFNRTSGPYRCRYCNQKLPKNKICVDHIIPVAQTQKSIFARLMLAMHGCRNVNDIRNLAPACRDCNSKKSDKMGLWVIRGWLGNHKSYWMFLRIFLIIRLSLVAIGLIWIIHSLIEITS